ncbi:SoxR reducing system RseC family protein [Acetobacterium bakii]|uniref:Sigma E factor regulator n=1 Tax=Acetobacterium bakii TaxID=52689 RepID=A0A0L6U0X5_9FIRM|nr:SoxR reducing system RseC family protein [Acetobacterium bakii]KNZ42171.1 sigma E factor regulator [Acetobacterium bakii]
MKEVGIVKELRGKTAKVVIKRNTACGDCGACHVSKDQSTMEAIAQNPVGAREGETVEVEMRFASVFKAASIMYGIPLVAFLLGSSLSYFIIFNNGLSWDQNLVPFFSGIALMAVAYAGIKYFDKKGIFNSKYQPIITGIIEKQEIEKMEIEKDPMDRIMG